MRTWSGVLQTMMMMISKNDDVCCIAHFFAASWKCCIGFYEKSFHWKQVTLWC